MQKKTKFKPHFRHNYSSKHPAYIYDEFNNEYVYIGLTHASKTKNKENVPLKVNPNRKDKRISYMRPFPERSKKKNFSKNILKGYSLSKKDYSTVKKIKKNLKK